MLRSFGFTVLCDIDVVPRLTVANGVTGQMTRRHIDGISFADQPKALAEFFDVATVEDFAARASNRIANVGRVRRVTGGATIYAKHLPAMSAFYEACFGLETVADAPGDYRVLESAGWTLSIVQVPADVAATIKVSNPPVRREATPIKLSFDVPSITASPATITERGGHVDEREWDFRGYRLCDFTDPEGNVNQLRAAIDPERRDLRP